MSSRVRSVPTFAVACALVWPGCTSYERSNPFDPENPLSQRDLVPVVLSFVYSNGVADSSANCRKAYAAYEKAVPPVQVLSF